MKKLALVILLILITHTSRAANVEFVASSPWVAILARFIGGTRADIVPLTTWESSRKRPGILITPDTNIIAIGRDEAQKLGIEDSPNLRLLYEKIPFDTNQNDIFYYFSDPSVLPFIAQKMLIAMGSLDPENISYYQRRLSEFQTRLNSTVLAGRHLLRGLKVLDLTGGNGYFLVAAGCEVVQPKKEDFDAWGRWKNMEKLNEALAQNQANNGVVIIDAITPKSVRTVASSFPSNILTSLLRPPIDEPFLTFLHNQYLLIWGQAKDKVPKQ